MQKSSSPIRAFAERIRRQRESLLRFNAIDNAYQQAREPHQFARTQWHRRYTGRCWTTRDRSASFVQRMLSGKKCKPRKRLQLAIDLYRPLEAAQLARIDAQRWIDDHPSYWAISEPLLAAYEAHRKFLGQMRDSGAELQSDEAAWSDALAKVERWLVMIEEASQSSAVQIDSLPDKPVFTFTQPEELDCQLDQKTEERSLAFAESIDSEPFMTGYVWLDKKFLGDLLGWAKPTQGHRRQTVGRKIRSLPAGEVRLGMTTRRIQVRVSWLYGQLEEKAERDRLRERHESEKALAQKHRNELAQIVAQQEEERRRGKQM